MGYRVVEGAGLRTTYCDTPGVVIHAVPDGPVALEVIFQAEPAPEGAEARFTRLWFDSVMEFRWVACEQEYFPFNRDDFEFALIEIVDSEQIARMLDDGMYANQPPGRRLGGTIDEADLRHYRIGFDEYGTLDMICLRLRVERFTAPSGSRFGFPDPTA